MISSGMFLFLSGSPGSVSSKDPTSSTSFSGFLLLVGKFLLLFYYNYYIFIAIIAFLLQLLHFFIAIIAFIAIIVFFCNCCIFTVGGIHG